MHQAFVCFKPLLLFQAPLRIWWNWLQINGQCTNSQANLHGFRFISFQGILVVLVSATPSASRSSSCRASWDFQVYRCPTWLMVFRSSASWRITGGHFWWRLPVCWCCGPGEMPSCCCCSSTPRPLCWPIAAWLVVKDEPDDLLYPVEICVNGPESNYDLALALFFFFSRQVLSRSRYPRSRILLRGHFQVSRDRFRDGGLLILLGYGWHQWF